MANYTIEFVRSSRKEFEKLPVVVRKKVVEALTLLSVNPYSEILKIKKLKGLEDLYRIRIGDYRVIYEIRNDKLIVIVIKIGHRSDVYKH